MPYHTQNHIYTYVYLTIIDTMSKNQQQANNDKLQNTQRQVDDVVGVMRDNVEMVLERDARLTDLEDRSNTLEDGAQRFQSVGRQVKRKMWYKNMKWWFILSGFIIVILIIIVLLIIKPWEK